MACQVCNGPIVWGNLRREESWRARDIRVLHCRDCGLVHVFDPSKKMEGKKLSDEEARAVRRELFGTGSDLNWLAEIKKRPLGHWSEADCEYAISRVEALEAEVELHRRKAKDEYWCWQGDGEDYPESLTCPVLIAVADLRAILEDLKHYEETVKGGKNEGADQEPPPF